MKRFGITMFTALVLCTIIVLAQEASKTRKPIQPFGDMPASPVPADRQSPASPEQPFGKIPGGAVPETKWGPQPATYPFGQIGSIGVPSSVKQPLSGNVPFSDIGAVGTPQSVYRPYKLDDFKGGLNLSSYKTKVAPNQAIVLENALWNEQGEMYKRPGYDTLKTTPEVFNFLYRYYQQDGDKYLMGGSDTALYFWQADSTTWTHLASTGGTSGRWDGTTYEDVFVGTHLGISPVFWDGDSIISVTVLESADSFWVEWSDIVMDTAYTDCYRFQSVFTLTSPPAAFEPNELVGFTFEWYKHVGSSEVQRMLVLSNTTDEIYATLPCSLDLVPDKAERWCWLRPWFNSTSVDSGTSDSVTVCYDDPNYCCFRPGDYAPSVRFWDSDLDTTKIERDWTYIFAATDSRGNVWRNYIGNHQAFGVTGGEPWVVMNGWMVACFNEETEYEIYRAKSLLEDEGIKYTETFDKRLWFGWGGTGVDQDKNILIYSNLRQFIFIPENEIYLTPGDGDYITGMISLSDARHVDVPTHVLMVSKNASSYKIIPTSTAGLYDSWHISTRVGCVSNSAMSVGEGLVLFPDQDGVWAWDQRSRPQCISLLIDPIFEGLALANLEDMSAIYNPQDRHYYLSGPEFFEETYPGGDFICVFEMDSAQSVDGYWIHEFDATGNETGDDVRKLGAAYTNAGGYLDIAGKGDKEYAVMLKQSSGATGFKVFLAFFDEDGAQIGDTLRIDDGGNVGYAVNDDHKLDMNSAGQIIACWTDKSDGNNDIQCQVVDFDTGLVGGNFYANSDSATNSDDYVFWGVGINEEGVAVITWQDLRDNLEALAEIYAQRFQYPDSVMGDNFRVNDCWQWNDVTCIRCCPPNDGPQGQCAWNENKPAVAVGPRTFVVAWYSSYGHCTGATCLYKRAFNIDGTAREDEILVSDCAGGNIQEPSIEINSLGNYVIAYDKECGDGASYAIYMMAFDSTDDVRLSETQVSNALTGQQGPDVAINNDNVIVVVWYDGGAGGVQITYRSYDWNGALMASDSTLSSSVYCQYPEIDCFLNPPDTSLYTLAWNIDYRGWSKETFSASAYAYQHGLTDPVKVLFADPENYYAYNYGTQADDVDDAVILTYQSPYFALSEHYPFRYRVKAATVESYLDTGTVYLDWYRDYSILAYQDSLMCGADCWQRKTLSADVKGKNVSVKLITGSRIDTFILSRIFWEYLIE